MINWNELCQASLDDSLATLGEGVQLPVVPQAIIEFNQLARSPNISARRLAAPIEGEPALTSRLLKHANSAAVGLHHKVHSVQQAISALGLRSAKLLLLTAALRQAFRGIDSPFVNATVFHRESQERSVFARETARLAGGDPEVAYTGAILQDLLLPLLTRSHLDEYGEFHTQSVHLVEFERERFGWDHARVAAKLMKDWGFPPELVCCVLFHHESADRLNTMGLLKTEAAAAAAAGMLPDSLRQCHAPVDWLDRLQQLVPGFHFLEIAARVDDVLGEGLTHAGNRVALSERLGQLVVDHLHDRGMQDFLAARQIGNYTLGELIGRGGMGVVYRGEHCHLNRPAAVKLLNEQQLSSRATARFESEAQLTSRLTSPHTVKIYDYGIAPQGVFYYVMEYIEGITLTRLVELFGPQPESRVVEILSQVCSSLTEAHDCGLLHRDIKPENIMLSRVGRKADFVKVLDFGLAELLDEGRQRGRQRMLNGTPHFMPPEAILPHGDLDARSDLYSLGAVGYFLLAGQPPFPGNNVHQVMCDQVHKPLRPLRKVRSAPLSADLEEVIMNCLEKDPDLRIENAEALNERLRQCRTTADWTPQSAIDWWAQFSEACGVAAPPSLSQDPTLVFASGHPTPAETAPPDTL